MQPIQPLYIATVAATGGRDGLRSNPVWLSAGRSQVLAAKPDEVARNMDDLTTYVDLVSLIIEEIGRAHV